MTGNYLNGATYDNVASTVRTMVQVEALFNWGNSNLGTSTLPVDGAGDQTEQIGTRAPAIVTWVSKLQLVYGAIGTGTGAASPPTSPFGAATAGKGTSPDLTDSQEYTLYQTGGAGAWLSGAKTYVAAAKVFLDAAWKDEVGTDGWESAFSEVLFTNTSDSSTSAGECTDGTGMTETAGTFGTLSMGSCDDSVSTTNTACTAASGTWTNNGGVPTISWATTTAGTSTATALSAASDTLSVFSHCA